MGVLKLKGKARNVLIQSDYDYIRAGSEDTGLYCLTGQQVMYLLSIVYMARWPTRWFSLIGTAVDKDWIDAFCSDIERQLMTDRCQEILDRLTALQTSVDEIDEDVDSIDTSITTINDNITNINNSLTVINNNVTNIDNNVKILNQVTINNTNIVINNQVNVQISALITFSNSSQDTTSTQQYARYNALCNAVVNWIYAEAYVVLSAMNAPTGDLSAVQGLMAAYALNVIYLLQSQGSSGYDIPTIYAAINDGAAVNDVACAIITKIANLPVTQPNFQAALSAYTPPALPDHRKVIYDTMGLALTDFDAYTPFVSMLGDAFQVMLASNPAAYYCPPCGGIPPLTVPYTWNFKATQAKERWLLIRGVMTPDDGYDAGIRAVRRFNGLVYAHDIWLEQTYANTNTVGKQLKLTAYYSADKDGDTANGNDQIFIAFSQDPGSGCPAFGTGSAVNFSPGNTNAISTVTVNFPAIGTTCGIRIWGTQNGGNICRRWYLEKVEVI